MRLPHDFRHSHGDAANEAASSNALPRGENDHAAPLEPEAPTMPTPPTPSTPSTHGEHDDNMPFSELLPPNPYKVNRGLTRAWHALKNSLSGFHIAVLTESAFRQELTLAAILVPIGALLPVPGVERVMLIASVLLVLIVELLNSSVEAAIDRISLERHELSRRAKDLGSAAVTVALTVCVLTWVVLVWPVVAGWLRR